MKSRHIEQLASQILYHKRLYYNGKSIISNEEYDSLEEELKKIAPFHPVLSFVGYQLEHSKNKVLHNVPMLSLAKTYSKDDLLSFLKQYECVSIDKFDGMALSLEYNSKGYLTQASTRGNGRFGENVTEQIYHIIDIPKILKLPGNLKNNRIEIRGEVYFPLSEFAKFSDYFDSFRNAIPGTLGRKDINDASEILKSFLFCPFEILIYDERDHMISFKDVAKLCKLKPLYSDKIKFIESLGFHLPENFIFKINQDNLNRENLDETIETLFSKKRDHQIDGLVFRVDDETKWEQLGNTAHHPRGALAFKKAGETAITKITDIETNVGRSGKITFRAKLKPVFLSNARISHATLHNAEFIEQGRYAIGADVKIIRSGEVIPSILHRVDTHTNTFEFPSSCLCGSILIRRGPDLWCAQKEDCEYSNQESLVHFVSKIEMYGLSEKIVYKLRAAGLLQEPACLYTLSVEDLLELEGFAQKSAQNIINAIHARKQIPLWQFLTALGIKGGGEVKCKDLAKKYQSLENIFKLSQDELASLKGWAQKSAYEFITSLHLKNKIISNLLKYITIINEKTVVSLSTNHFCYGKQVCITGALTKPRAEIKKLLENLGAKVVSNVTSKTDYLICNEASNSSKFKEATKLNIPILTEEQFFKKCGNN